MELPKAYNPNDHEQEIYKLWEESGAFTPKIVSRQSSVVGREDESAVDRQSTNDKPFVISMPPPNVTGKLHIGHALFITLQDIMTRYHRMKGEPTLWLPGTDHAGIATQSVVDKALRKKDINRFEIGREKFIEEVWKWKEEYGTEITRQLRSVGASCDWTRERFTLDEGLSSAVNEAFKRLYDKGLIYRGEYIVNWCPKCATAISDDEVEHKTQKTKLYFFKYDKKFPITIATTRPETKLGDTGVAVNPSDKRYKNFIGKEYEVDLDGVKRKIKVFADRAVDMKFGTGAVGVTPAHSVIDWKMAEDNNLEKIKVIDERGKMAENAGKYAGLKVSEAREKLVEYLRDNNLLEQEKDFENNLSICYRCGGVIEPLPSLQWFVKMKPLAQRAKAAVMDGEIKIVPKRFEKVYFHWLDNIRDWCISRQLWWGHRIPVWYKGEEIFVGTEAPEDDGWTRDEDVLDTWFSSGLWPFSTLGWPNSSDVRRQTTDDKQPTDYEYFYPTTVMETGYDILFFWVARMVMMGLELTGKVPFKTVYLHGLVRDEQNRKMSKSLGNVLDPLDISSKFGTDAMRMALVVGTTAGSDIAIGEGKIKGYRNFSNKIWNIARFVLTNFENLNIDLKFKIKNLKLSEPDKDLEKLAEIVKEVTKYLDELKFSQAGELLYEYTWHEFADKIIEESKERLAGEDEEDKKACLAKLITILTTSLKLLHPFVPFVTETIWQEMPDDLKDEKLLISAKWPE